MFILIRLSGGRCGSAEKWSTRHTSYKWHEELTTRPVFLVKYSLIHNLSLRLSHILLFLPQTTSLNVQPMGPQTMEAIKTKTMESALVQTNSLCYEFMEEKIKWKLVGYLVFIFSRALVCRPVFETELTKKGNVKVLTIWWEVESGRNKLPPYIKQPGSRVPKKKNK